MRRVLLLFPLTAYRAVVFDLDGTLLDTMPDIIKVGNELLSEHGIPGKTRDDYAAAVGMGLETLYAKLLGGQVGENLLARLVNRASEAFNRMDDFLAAPYPGIKELLEMLSSRGIPMAILSNKPQRAAEICTKHFFPDVPFLQIVGSQPGKPVKPEKSSAEAIMKAMGVSPGETLMAGDGEPDMLVAENAGMIPVACAWGFTPGIRLMELGARFLARKPMDIWTLVNSGALQP